VIAAAAGALPEVLGEAAHYVPPGDADGVAAAMAALAGDRGERERRRALGLERAAGYTWERTARRTLMVYRAALGEADDAACLGANR
jgi:alpha-1,3-rhamnosyl/mannosyltransferase